MGEGPGRLLHALAPRAGRTTTVAAAEQQAAAALPVLEARWGSSTTLRAGSFRRRRDAAPSFEGRAEGLEGAPHAPMAVARLCESTGTGLRNERWSDAV